MDLIDCLIKAGFTKHESVLYLTLCKEGELTGYEAAKISGIPRSNAYLALSGLVEKGGAGRIDTEAVKYAAVPAKELAVNIRRSLDEALDYIENNAPVREVSKEAFITIEGKTHIVQKMRNIISQANERVYLSVSPQELEYVRAEIEDAVKRELKVVIITSQQLNMTGITLYLNEKQPGQIRVITDTSHVLTGELAGERDSTCLYSRNRNLIQLIKDSLTNEIKLIQLREQEKEN